MNYFSCILKSISKEMDSKKQIIPWTNGQMQVLKSNECKFKLVINSCHTHSLFEVLQSLRKYVVINFSLWKNKY